ncbi:MAG: hypothetical protein ACI8WT_002093 [Clostridium sp.]|jgi:hypothetical protein
MKNISYQFKKKFILKFKIVKVIICVIVMFGVIMVFPHFFRNTYIVTIASKRIITLDNTDTYLIYTQMEDGNIKIFKNTNSLIEFKIHSENVYWGLIISGKYEIKAYGWSMPLLSTYQNIIKVKGIK